MRSFDDVWAPLEMDFIRLEQQIQAILDVLSSIEILATQPRRRRGWEYSDV